MERPDSLSGGLAVVLAHPADESFSCAGAMALAHDSGRPVRLLVMTRGEASASTPQAGTESGEEPPAPDPQAVADLADIREDELRCAAGKIGMQEITVFDHPDGGLAEVPFSQLVSEIGDWLRDRQPDAVITFGAHGVTGHPDHVVVGSATRWAVERLSESGEAPHAVYVVSPIFERGTRRYDLSAEEGAATHRIDVTSVAGRKLAALECHASQADAADEAAELRAILDRDGVLYEGYTRVRPLVPSPHPQFDPRLL